MIILDTGGVLAAFDSTEDRHAAAANILESSEPRILSPFVLAELDYLIATRISEAVAVRLLEDVSNGVYVLARFDNDDMAAAVGVIQRYADLQLGLADASVMVLAHRYNCPDILTVDQRHFRAVVGLDGRPFRLLPADM